MAGPAGLLLQNEFPWCDLSVPHLCAVILSFAITGAVCLLTALCYGELGSRLPLSGSTYSYAYATLGAYACAVLSLRQSVVESQNGTQATTAVIFLSETV